MGKSQEYWLWQLPKEVLDQLECGNVCFWKNIWWTVIWLASDKVELRSY